MNLLYIVSNRWSTQWNLAFIRLSLRPGYFSSAVFLSVFLFKLVFFFIVWYRAQWNLLGKVSFLLLEAILPAPSQTVEAAAAATLVEFGLCTDNKFTAAYIQ